MLGKRISHYRIVEKLGQGGMGEVYLAEDTRLGRKVALKFLAPELARDRESLARFRTEAKAAAELSHPNIATIYDIGEVDGRPFLVLEYLRGRSLRARIEQGPLPVEETLRIGKALANGLAAAHAHGIVHRDVKSANIMLTDDGGVKILDFGLARLGDATQITRPGTTFGTIYYMAPEQVLGRPADPRSDIWSLGIVLYECLTGRLPFIGESASILEQIKLTEPDAPTGLRSGIPLELEQAILRCLEKDPDLRYQRSEDLLSKFRAIESHLGASPKVAPKVSSSTGENASTSRGRRALLGVVATVILLGATWLLYRELRENGESTTSHAPTEFSVAVIDFQDMAPDQRVSAGLMMTNLVQGGLIQSSPCRVLTLEYLKDIRRRRFGDSGSGIAAEQALEIARTAGASALVFADVIESHDRSAVNWRLVDAQSGEALGAGRCQSEDVLALADSTVAGILPVLVASCGGNEDTSAEPVSLTTTTSPEAYAHYVDGIAALEEYEHDKARSELQAAIALDPDFALAYFAMSKCHTADAPAQWAEEAWERRSCLNVLDRLRLEAWRMRLNNQLAGARQTQEEILSRWPDHRETLQDIVETLYMWGNEEESLQVAKRALEMYPDDGTLFGWVVANLNVMWRPRELIEVLRSAPPSYSESRRYSELANSYLMLGQANEARENFLEAYEISQKRSAYHDSMALVAFCAGDLEEAISHTDSLLMLGEFSANLTKANLGATPFWNPGLRELQRLAGRFEEAGQFIDEVRALPFASERGRLGGEYSIGTLLLRWGYPERALPIARRLATVEGDRYTVQRGTRLLARCLVSVDSLDAAWSQVRKIQEWEGGLFRRWAHWTNAEIALAEGRPQDALTELEEVVFLMGMYDIEVRELRARAHREAGQLDAATNTLEELLRIYGGYAIAHYQLAHDYESMERWADAETEYERFLEMWSNADEGLPELVDARQRLGNLRSRH